MYQTLGKPQDYKEVGDIVCVFRESVGVSLGESGRIHKKRLVSRGSLCLLLLWVVGKPSWRRRPLSEASKVGEIWIGRGEADGNQLDVSGGK